MRCPQRPASGTTRTRTPGPQEPARSEVCVLPAARTAVLITDDHAVVRAGLRTLVEQEDDLVVAGEAATVEDTEGLAARRRPDVLLLDLGLPGDALAAARRMHAELPAMGIVAFSERADDGVARAALAAGAAAFVGKHAGRAEVIAAVRAAAGSTVALERGAHPLGAPTGDDRDGLSARERDVLRLIALGHTNAEVATLLYLSVRTVETHRAHLHRRLGLHSRHELVVHALRRGLLTEDEPV